MGWKSFLSLMFFLVVISLLFFYWFIPWNEIEFGIKEKNSNFSLSGLDKGNTQFYPNMRYPSPEISYKISGCPLKKKNDMEQAFDILNNKTILRFYSVDKSEEISVTCDSNAKVEGGMFIAGEGGPINITKTNNFNVILNGKILLLRESECERPNIAIHELLHALGFEHSPNPNNIMYNFSKCSQIIGDDTFELINKLYSVPSYSDLDFEDVSAIMRGKYLDLNISVRNNGLVESGAAKIEIYADDKFLKEIELNPIDIGYGRIIILSNVWVPKISVKELKFFINSSFNELDKNNNVIVLKI